MPFGCNGSSEIFQKKLFQCLDGLTGIHCETNAIMITGRGETDKMLLYTMRITDFDIFLNPDKIMFGFFTLRSCTF